MLLDEYAAWCEIAMLCESCGPVTNRYGDVLLMSSIFGTTFNGLCNMTVWLSTEWPEKLRETVLERLVHHADNGDLYFWPRTLEGWSQRTAFAWAMAEECARELDGEETT